MSIPVPMRGFGGGGGAALNFDVKAYATEEALLADTPKENTIGIITTTAINGWVFSATEPAEPVEGMVWISTGTTSTIEFNALKKNGIQVCPLSVKQYISGAWVDVAAMSYQDGEWVNFTTCNYLYNNGDTCNNLTGGWKASGVDAGTYWDAKAPTLVFESSEMVMSMASPSSGNGKSGVVHTVNKIDLSNTNKLIFEGTAEGPTSSNCRLVLMSAISASSFSAIAAISLSGEGSTTELDTSALNESYYVAFYLGGSINNTDSEIRCTSLEMEMTT